MATFRLGDLLFEDGAARDLGTDVEEHAFVPGDGENTHPYVCQFPGCGLHLSLHEEGEPCCIAAVTSGGRDHEPDCKEA